MRRRGRSYRHPLHDLAGLLVGIAAVAGWLATLWLHHQGTLGTAATTATAVLLLAVVIAVVLGIERSARRARDAAPDPLTPFHGYRMVEHVSLHANGEDDATLRLELTRELGDGDPVRFEFTGTADLQLNQIFHHPIWFSRLRSRELPPDRDGMRHEVWDEHNDTIRFRCRAIMIATPATPTAAPSPHA